MSKRTKMKLNNLHLYLVKYVFNGRYIVRNTLAVTVLVTVIAAIYGVVSVVGMNDGGNKEKSGGAVSVAAAAETDNENPDTQKLVLNVTETPMMNAGSINILMAGLDTDTETDIRPNETQMVTEKNGGIFVAIAEDGVNVRAAASTEAELVGSLYQGDTGYVLGREGDWLHISMLDINGYVKQDYVLTGDEAEAYIEEHTRKEEKKEDTEDKDKDDKDEKDKKDKSEGSIDKKKTQDDEKPSDKTTEQQTPSVETPATEAPGNTESKPDTSTEQQTPPVEDSTEEPEDTSGSGSTTVGVTYRSAVSLSEADINLMASVMTLECGGESYEGQLAVANVILNRYLSGAYGSTMSDVCYAPYQFSVVSLPQFQSYVQNGAQASCLQAAREALSGVNNIGGFVSFRPASNVSNPASLGSYTIIGNHIFF